MTVIVDNTGFNVLYWSRFTDTEFIEQNLKHGVFKQYQDKDRRDLLAFAYKQINHDIAQSSAEPSRI